jgi:anti-sigma B factor antagonist
VVTLPAEIDLTNVPVIAAQLDAALAVGVATVIADMRATTFCDSAGIRMLLLASKRAAANNTELRLLAPTPAVLQIIAILGVGELLTACPTLEEAFA